MLRENSTGITFSCSCHCNNWNLINDKLDINIINGNNLLSLNFLFYVKEISDVELSSK